MAGVGVLCAVRVGLAAGVVCVAAGPCVGFFQAGNRAGQYREGYEAYGRLLTRIGEAKHQSCLLLTSWEKPKELAQLEGKTAPVRVMLLAWLEQAEGQALLKDKGLLASEETWAALIRLYSGLQGNTL